MEVPGAAPAADDIEAKIKAQGDKVRELKSAKAEKAAIDEAVKALIALKAEYKAATGKDWKPPSEPKAAIKKAVSPPAAAAAAATPELTGPAAAADAAIKAQGEVVRKLKTEKADKAAVDDAVKKLLALKGEFKAAAGMDWKPVEQKKENKGKENKVPAAVVADGEKSDTQKKRDAKKAEKANKKAAHKSEEGANEEAVKDDGPDVSSGK